MQKKLLIIATAVLLLAVGLSGCTQTSDASWIKITNHYAGRLIGTIEIDMYEGEAEGTKAYGISMNITLGWDEVKEFPVIIPSHITVDEFILRLHIESEQTGAFDTVEGMFESRIISHTIRESFKVYGYGDIVDVRN